MHIRVLSTCFLLSAVLFPLSGAEKLLAPAAPFAGIKTAKKAKKPEAPGKPVLDGKKMTFFFGNKRVIVDQSGTFVILSGSRKLADSYFVASTPAKSWNTNHNKKIVKKYDGSGLCVTGTKADQAAGTITITGLLAFNKPGTPEVIHKWERIFSLENGKLRIRNIFHCPAGMIKNGKGGIFFSLVNHKDYTSKHISRNKKIQSYRTPDITVQTRIPEDSFKIEVHSGMILQKKKKTSSIYLTPSGENWDILIDFGKYGKAVTMPPGGVDFKQSDDFDLPTTGKNLLPNPYFGQGSAFLNDGNVHSWQKDSGNALVTGDALFGKYSLKAANYHSATIPADPGNYVFSVYAKGKGTLSISISAKAPWRNVTGKRIRVNSPDKWKRLVFPFHFPRQEMLGVNFNFRGKGLIDGIQLEKGTKATAFSAPKITARFITTPEHGFLESGKPMTGVMELSTLEKQVSGTAVMTIRNFFKETVRKKTFSYSLKKGEYPRVQVPLAGLQDGVYVIETVYSTKGSSKKHVEHFRFSIMPFLKNKHFTRRIFSPRYGGGSDGIIKNVSEKKLARWRALGFGSYGHGATMTQKVYDAFMRYGIQPFNGGSKVSYGSSRDIAKRFPHLKVPEGKFYFYIRNPDHWFRSKEAAAFPDYRLVGGWTPEYREKFKAELKKQLRKGVKDMVYFIGAEWAADIKNDPHYPDLVATYFEAVKEFNPKALVAEGGGMNMFPHDGIRQVDIFLERYLKKGYKKPDFISGHPYYGTTGINAALTNFNILLKVAEKHGMKDCQLSFPEGMHYHSYDIPEWDCRSLSAEKWRLRAPFSYDLGWIERQSAAYYARSWLVYMTEFKRVWCVTSAMGNTNNIIMDFDFTPRVSQKIPNTLSVLFPNPRRYIGDYSFAPETKCLIWEDHEGRPIAAVWNENEAINTGYKAVPWAETSYRGAEYIDLMGAYRKPEKDGVFPVSAFPLFIRGRKGDCKAFTEALRKSRLKGGEALPFRMTEQFAGDGSLLITLSNEIANEIRGTLTVGKRKIKVNLPPHKEQKFKIALPRALSDSQIRKIDIPLIWDNGRETIRRNFTSHAFMIRRFTGDWNKIPTIKMTNKIIKKGFKDDGFAASFKIAWNKDKMLLRIMVKDDYLCAGKGNYNRYSFDAAQVYFDTLCSARKTGKTLYDDDDYDLTLMPTQDGKRCEVFRALSPFMQYTQGTSKAKDNTIAPEIPATFTRTGDGYIYQVEFPAAYIRPLTLENGWNFGFGLLVSDRDKAKQYERGYSLSTVPGAGCYNRPLTWPVAVLSE